MWTRICTKLMLTIPQLRLRWRPRNWIWAFGKNTKTGRHHTKILLIEVLILTLNIQTCRWIVFCSRNKCVAKWSKSRSELFFDFLNGIRGDMYVHLQLRIPTYVETWTCAYNYMYPHTWRHGRALTITCTYIRRDMDLHLQLHVPTCMYMF